MFHIPKIWSVSEFTDVFATSLPSWKCFINYMFIAAENTNTDDLLLDTFVSFVILSSNER